MRCSYTVWTTLALVMSKDRKSSAVIIVCVSVPPQPCLHQLQLPAKKHATD